MGGGGGRDNIYIFPLPNALHKEPKYNYEFLMHTLINIEYST